MLVVTKGVNMGKTTLRELYNIGLISRKELSVLKKKIGYISHKGRLRTPPGQHRIPTSKLSHYVDYSRTGNGYHCLQSELNFGSDCNKTNLTRPVLTMGYQRRGPTVSVCPLTTKQQDENSLVFFIQQENWSLLNTSKNHIKDCIASPHCETVHIRSLELFGSLDPNLTKEIKHWLKQINAVDDSLHKDNNDE